MVYSGKLVSLNERAIPLENYERLFSVILYSLHIITNMGLCNFNSILIWSVTAPWLRRLLSACSPRRPDFSPSPVHVGFVVDKVALGQVSFRVLRFPAVISFHHYSTPILAQPDKHNSWCQRVVLLCTVEVSFALVNIWLELFRDRNVMLEFVSFILNLLIRNDSER
jgi:hypothetical protein